MPFVGAAIVARASLIIMNSSTFDDVLAYMFDYVGLPVLYCRVHCNLSVLHKTVNLRLVSSQIIFIISIVT